MNITRNIEKCFPDMESKFSDKDLKEFLECSYEHLHRYHFGLGKWIRIHLLDEKDALYSDFIDCGVTQKDDMSALMIQLFYMYMQNKYHAL